MATLTNKVKLMVVSIKNVFRELLATHLSANLTGTSGANDLGESFSSSFSPLFWVAKFVSYPKNSIVEILGDYTKKANF